MVGERREAGALEEGGQALGELIGEGPFALGIHEAFGPEPFPMWSKPVQGIWAGFSLSRRDQGIMSTRSFHREAWAPLAKALKAYARGDRNATLTVHSDAGEPETMEVGLFFRTRENLRAVDREALLRARGTVLDVGAGVGCISLILQSDGFRVTAVEMIPEAVEIMRSQGIEEPWGGRVEGMERSKSFDTLLLLMNGSAIAGTLAGFSSLLEVLDGLLAPGGQILLDSTDIRSGRLPTEGSMGPTPEGIGDVGGYPGELQYQMEFRGEKGAPFPQLFLDPETLETLANGRGFSTEIVWTGSEGEYLACLERRGE